MFRLLTILSLLLAAGCATSHEAPTQYERGTYRPVRAPTFRPHEDAPHTTGQPGHLPGVQTLPPSPHTRVLPATAEPGLWSGDQPRASAGEDEWPSILGVPVPYPDYAKEDNDLRPYRICGTAAQGEIVKLATKGKLRRFHLTKECMAAALFMECLKDLPGAYPKDDALHAAVKKASVLAVTRYKDACGPLNYAFSQSDTDFFSAVVNGWRKSAGKGQ